MTSNQADRGTSDSAKNRESFEQVTDTLSPSAEQVKVKNILFFVYNIHERNLIMML